MRQYRIDELRFSDYEKIKEHLDAQYGNSQVDGIYWVPLEDDFIDEVQTAHAACQPFYFAVELSPQAISFELLIRTRKRMRCDCIRYANSQQRDHIFRFADRLFEKLKLMS
jgi:hypothetical protein